MDKSGTNLSDLAHRDSWESPFGMITVTCSQKGIRELALGPVERPRKRRNGPGEPLELQGAPLARNVARQAIVELQEYAAGRRTRFTVPLDLRGTPFQMKVWNALLRIPYGETRSYQQVAREVGNPRASRAVGMANHRNPVAIIVPCHRVISSDGSLGGYAGGLDTKARMLHLEHEHSK